MDDPSGEPRPLSHRAHGIERRELVDHVRVVRERGREKDYVPAERVPVTVISGDALVVVDHRYPQRTTYRLRRRAHDSPAMRKWRSSVLRPLIISSSESPKDLTACSVRMNGRLVSMMKSKPPCVLSGTSSVSVAYSHPFLPMPWGVSI